MKPEDAKDIALTKHIEYMRDKAKKLNLKLDELSLIEDFLAGWNARSEENAEPSMVCGCGQPATYTVKDGKGACNKYMRCLNREEATDALAVANKRLIQAVALFREADEYLEPKMLGQVNYIATMSILHAKMKEFVKDSPQWDLKRAEEPKK